MKRISAPFGVPDLLEDRLQALLELAAVLRAGEQRADVEGPDALALQRLRHVAGDDPLGEPFGDRGLPHPGLADQHRVVLRAAAEDLDHAANLLVAPDHRVELPLLGRLGQVAPELLERLVRPLRVLRRDVAAAAYLLDPREDLLARRRRERQEEMLGRDVVVLELPALVVGRVEHACERGGRVRLLAAALDGRKRVELALRLGPQALPVGEELLAEQRDEQVLGRHLGVAAAARQLLRLGDRLLALDGQLVEIHVPRIRFDQFVVIGGCDGR